MTTPDPLTPDERRLRELCNEATPGPWLQYTHYYAESRAHYVCRNAARFDFDIGEFKKLEDSRYSSAADPTTIAALLDELAALRSENARLVRMMEGETFPMEAGLVWSIAPPTEPGLYINRIRDANKSARLVEVLHWPVSGELCAGNEDFGFLTIEHYRNYQWAGPIPLPKEPSK